MDNLKVPIDAKTRQNLLDIDRVSKELQMRKVLILQTISNIMDMKNPVVVGQYDCLQEKDEYDKNAKPEVAEAVNEEV